MVLNKGRQHNRVSEACSRRVRRVAERLGYVPNYHARSMKLGRAEVMGVAIDLGSPLDGDQEQTSPLWQPYFAQISGGIEIYLHNVGYQMSFIGPDSTMRAPDRGYLGIRQRRFDGLAVFGNLVRNDLTDFMLRSPEGPVVAIEYPGPTELAVVDFDEAQAVRLAVEHLASLGHKDLLWVGDAPGDKDGVPNRERVFLDCVRQAALRGQVCRMAMPPAGAVSPQLVAEGFLGFLQQGAGHFTAVVCYNDLMGIGVCSALAKLGKRIPAEVSVVGIDDVEASLCIPCLTSVSHAMAEMGRRTAEMLMEMIQDESARKRLRGTRHMVQPRLVIRESTGPAAH